MRGNAQKAAFEIAVRETAGTALGDLLRALEREHEQVGTLLFDAQHRLVASALVAVDGQATCELATPGPPDGPVGHIVAKSLMMIGG